MFGLAFLVFPYRLLMYPWWNLKKAMNVKLDIKLTFTLYLSVVDGDLGKVKTYRPTHRHIDLYIDIDMDMDMDMDMSMDMDMEPRLTYKRRSKM